MLLRPPRSQLLPTGGYSGTVTLSARTDQHHGQRWRWHLLHRRRHCGHGDPHKHHNQWHRHLHRRHIGSDQCTLLSERQWQGPQRELAGLGVSAVVAFIVFLGIPARRRSWRQMLGLLVLIAALGALSSCGGGGAAVRRGGTSDPGTTAGTYTFTVYSHWKPHRHPSRIHHLHRHRQLDSTTLQQGPIRKDGPWPFQRLLFFCTSAWVCTTFAFAFPFLFPNPCSLLPLFLPQPITLPTNADSRSIR